MIETLNDLAGRITAECDSAGMAHLERGVVEPTECEAHIEAGSRDSASTTATLVKREEYLGVLLLRAEVQLYDGRNAPAGWRGYAENLDGLEIFRVG